MKIFIGSENACGLNYQHDFIYSKLSESFEIITNVSDADVIVIAETCCCTQYNLRYTLNYIASILKDKKESVKTYLTGCITRTFEDNEFLSETEKWLKDNIDFIIPQNQPNLLLKLISEDVFGNVDINDFGMVATGASEGLAEIYISNGCLNNCSFCKVTFQKYPLKSVELSEIKEAIDSLNEQKYLQIFLKGTNVCQYGLDIYHEYMLPEVISYLEKKENIKRVILVGFSFKDAIKNYFQSVIAHSDKVVELCGSLESGSDRLLELIRKGFTSEEIINFVHNIRKINYKSLYLNIISGFPTETLADVKRTLEVLKQLDPYMVDVCRYTNSEFIDSSHYEQLSSAEIQDHTRIYSRTLQKRNVKVNIVGHGYKYN